MTRSIASLSRREFLEGLAVAGGSLILVASLPGCERLSDALAKGGNGGGATFTPNVYLVIDGTGQVTTVIHRSEMGQGSRTTLAMAIADELEADWSRVKVEQAPGDEKTYGDQNTDGSTSIRKFVLPLRQAGATARAMLETAAAARWSVPVSEVKASNHEVVHQESGRKLGFGELAEAAGKLAVPAKETVKLKDPSEFRYLGKNIPMVELFDITVGKANYGIDQVMPGMKYAVIARPPVYGGKVASVDDSAAKAVAGVERIVRLPETPVPAGFQPLGGVAVIATNTWAAIEGRKKLKITWDDGPNKSYDSVAYRKTLEASVRAPGKVARNEGDVDQAFARATRKLEADYYVPHLAHAQMEPPAALAVVKDGRCEVWAPVQSPQGARNELVKALKLTEDKVRVNVTLLGGAFGRKSKPDFVVEAALLSREVGAPVKVTWTREDDLHHGYYHTVSAQHVEAALDAKGKPIAWHHRTAFPSISSTFAPNVTGPGDDELELGFVDLPYEIPNIRLEKCPAEAHVRIGWLRSVCNIQHAFAINSFADELAHAARRDPKDYLLELLGQPREIDLTKGGFKPTNYGEDIKTYPIDTGRLAAVVELAAKEAGWGKKLPRGRAQGIAVHRSFVTYVAAVVEVEVGPGGKITIPRVDMAVDCGFAAHPDRIKNQMEGAAVMGVSHTLLDELTFKEGRAVQNNFDGYRLLAINAAPKETHVHIVSNNHPPGGVGEPGLPPIAPALCNAIFAATGKRIRSLPIGNQLA